MSDQAKVLAFIDEDDVKSFEQALSPLELILAIVQKVIDRNVYQAVLMPHFERVNNENHPNPDHPNPSHTTLRLSKPLLSYGKKRPPGKRNKNRALSFSRTHAHIRRGGRYQPLPAVA